MENTDKTKEQLIEEIDQLKVKITEVEKSKSEIKRTEEALRENEEKVHGMIMNLMEGFYSVTLDGKLLVYNDEFVKILGLEKNKDYSGIDLPNFWQNPMQRKDYIEELMKNGFIKNYEINAKKANGEKIFVQANSRLIKDEEGKPIRIEGTFLNITGRQQAEEEIKNLSSKWQATFNAMTDSVGIMDLDGTFDICNKATFSLFNINEEDIKTKKCFQMVHGTNEPFPNCPIERMKKSKKPERMVFKEKENWFQVSVDPIFKDNGELAGAVHVVSDITERKQAEEEIHRFSRIFEDSLNEIFLFDAETLVFTKVNGAAQKNLGYTMEELQKMTPLDFKPEFTNESFTKLVEPLRNGEKDKIVFETVHQRKDQSLYNVEIHLQLLHFDNESMFVAIILDITERKQAEEKLKESEKRYRALLLNLEAGIVVHAPDTSIVMNNPRASELLGLSDEQMIGKEVIDPAWKFVNEDNIPFALEDYPVNKIITSKQSLLNQVLGVHRPNTNDIVWLTVNGFPALNNKGAITEIVISFIDITERKKNEEELVKHRDNLKEMVNERTKELEDKNKELDNALKVFVGRELTIKNLQERIRALGGK